jgi:hypothetical protein
MNAHNDIKTQLAAYEANMRNLKKVMQQQELVHAKHWVN